MFSTVTSPTNGPQTLLLPHDANERTSCPVIHVQHPRFPEASGLECEKEMQGILAPQSLASTSLQELTRELDLKAGSMRGCGELQA